MNTNMIQPRAILLDFYGTVVEEHSVPITNICHKIASASRKTSDPREISLYWNRVFHEMCYESHGTAFKRERDLEPESIEAVLQHFDASLDIAQLIRSFNSLWDEYWLKPDVFPESENVIARIKESGMATCLVSNVDNSDLNSALKYCQLTFDYVVTSENCKAYKPRSEPFMKALSLLKLSSREVIHVGDSLNCDVVGARLQQIPVLWINRRGIDIPAEHEKPDYISSNLTGILNVLEIASD